VERRQSVGSADNDGFDVDGRCDWHYGQRLAHRKQELSLSQRASRSGKRISSVYRREWIDGPGGMIGRDESAE
jgi:hypothetical protein